VIAIPADRTFKYNSPSHKTVSPLSPLREGRTRPDPHPIHGKDHEIVGDDEYEYGDEDQWGDEDDQYYDEEEDEEEEDLPHPKHQASFFNPDSPIGRFMAERNQAFKSKQKQNPYFKLLDWETLPHADTV